LGHSQACHEEVGATSKESQVARAFPSEKLWEEQQQLLE